MSYLHIFDASPLLRNPLAMSDPGPFDPRQQRVLPEPPAVAVPLHLQPGALSESVRQAKQAQRQERAEAVNRLFQAGHIKDADSLFLYLQQEDRELIEAVPTRLRMHLTLMLRELEK